MCFACGTEYDSAFDKDSYEVTKLNYLCDNVFNIYQNLHTSQFDLKGQYVDDYDYKKDKLEELP